MKKLIISTAIASIVLTGCATTQTFGSKEQAQEANKQTRNQAIKGALTGCGAGLLGSALGIVNTDAMKACLGGAVVGGTIMGVKAYKEQVAQAKAVADEANTLGAKAVIETKTVSTKEGTSEALEALKIDLAPADVAGKKPNVQRIVDKATRMADQSISAITITIEGSPSEVAWLSERVQTGLSPDTKVKVEQKRGVAPRLVLSPVPDVG